MSRWYAQDIPIGQADGGVRGKILDKKMDSNGNVTLYWSSGRESHHGPKDVIRDVCCGSCRAAGKPSSRWGNANDRVTRRAAREARTEK